jgi:heat shock protein beta
VCLEPQIEFEVSNGMTSFLVADEVHVASIPPKSARNPNPEQYIFTSKADENSFQTFADPRGNTLGHGTEITLTLREDAKSYLDTETVRALV